MQDNIVIQEQIQDGFEKNLTELELALQKLGDPEPAPIPAEAINEWVAKSKHIFFNRCDAWVKDKSTTERHSLDTDLEGRLAAHWRGSAAISPHSLAGEVATSKWVAVDIDAPSGVDWDSNRLIAAAIYERALALGLAPLLDDSGKGSYRVWIFFEKSISGEKAYRLAVYLRSNYDENVFAHIETRPAKPEYRTAKKLGCSLRMPGKHPKKGWSRLWDGSKWVEISSLWDLVRFSDPAAIPADVDSIPLPEPEIIQIQTSADIVAKLRERADYLSPYRDRLNAYKAHLSICPVPYRSAKGDDSNSYIFGLAADGIGDYGLHPGSVLRCLRTWCGRLSNSAWVDQYGDKYLAKAVAAASKRVDLASLGANFAALDYIIAPPSLNGAGKGPEPTPSSVQAVEPAAEPAQSVGASTIIVPSPLALTSDQAAALQAADDAACIDKPPYKPVEKRKDKRAGYALADFMGRKPPKWLIRSTIPEQSLFCIWGPPSAKKTFLAVDMALSIATGTDFLGRHPVKQGNIVYISAEGQNLFKNRWQAWLKHNGIESVPSNIFIIPHRFDFMDKDEFETLTKIIDETVGEFKPDCIFCDTLARLMGSGRESDPSDMGRFVDFCDDLKEHYRAAVGVVHHSGKDIERGERGANSLRGGLDTSISLVSDPGSKIVTVNCAKQKDAEEFAEFKLLTELITLGTDDEGLPITSLVLLPAADTTQKWESATAATREFASELYDRFGDRSFGWQEAREALGYIDESGDKTKLKYQRRFDNLKKTGLVGQTGTRYRIVDELLTLLKLQIMAK